MTQDGLLDLVWQFDRTDPADIEGRIAIAEKMRPLLGQGYDTFDRLYELVQDRPHPAEEALRLMGFGDRLRAIFHEPSRCFDGDGPPRHLAVLIDEARAQLREGASPMAVSEYVFKQASKSDVQVVVGCLLQAHDEEERRAIQQANAKIQQQYDAINRVIKDLLVFQRDTLAQQREWIGTLSKNCLDLVGQTEAAVRGTKAAGCWLKQDLFDDHAPGTVRRDQLIGYALGPSGDPVWLCCGTEGMSGVLSLNEVVIDRSLAAKEDKTVGAHLTRRSVLVLQAAEVRALHERGEVVLGETVVRLVEGWPKGKR